MITDLTQDVLTKVRLLPNVQKAYVFNNEIWFWGNGSKKSLMQALKPLSSDSNVGIFKNTDENNYRSQWKGNFYPIEVDNTLN